MKKLLALLVLILTFSFTTSAFAASESKNEQMYTPPTEEQKANEQMYTPPTEEQKAIELIVIQADIEAREEAFKELAPTFNSLNGGHLEDTIKYQEAVQKKIDQKLEKRGKKYGIKRVAEEESDKVGISAVVSPPSNEVAVNKPTIYTSSQGYYLQASAVWKKDSWGSPYWYHHRPSFGSAVGGEDGLGIFFGDTTNIEISTSSFYTYDNFGVSYNTNLAPHKSEPKGVYYKAQDYYDTPLEQIRYDWDKSYITVWPRFKGKVNTEARTHFSHTWSTTKITGVTLGSGGFTVSFSTTNNAYNGQSTTGATVIY